MISVIVPVYNREKYLEECVESILNQDYKDIELILSDDGSTDSSPAMCDEYEKKDSRVKVIHKKNSGQGSARNMGIDIAKGDYLSFIDSDDWVEKDMYTSLMAAAEGNNADICVCEVALVNEDGTRTEKHRVKGLTVLGKDEAMAHRMDNSEIVTDSPCNKLYRRALFGTLRYPEDRILSEDSAVMYKLIDKSQTIVLTGKVGYDIRCDSSSVSRRKYNRRRCETIKTFSEMSDFFAANKRYNKFVPAADSYIAGAVFYNAGEMYGVDFEGREETVKYIRECADKLLKSGKNFGFKSRFLLKLIAFSPALYGKIYKVSKKK